MKFENNIREKQSKWVIIRQQANADNFDVTKHVNIELEICIAKLRKSSNSSDMRS